MIDFQGEAILAAAVDRVSAVTSEGPYHCFTVDLRGGQGVVFTFPTEAKARTGREDFVALWRISIQR